MARGEHRPAGRGRIGPAPPAQMAGRSAAKPRRRPPDAEPPATADAVRIGELDGFIGYNLRMAQGASFRAFARSVGSRGLRAGHFAALRLIHDNVGISQTALGRAIARDKSTVTPLIQDMERRGLIKRERSAIDRRSVTLRLTAAGTRMLDELMAHALEHDRKLDAIVGKSKPRFLALLRKIVDELS